MDARREDGYLDPNEFVFICYDRTEFFNEQNFDFLFMELDPEESDIVSVKDLKRIFSHPTY